MILAADIGGTHSRFGLFDGERLIVEHRLASAGFTDFPPALAAFLARIDNRDIQGVCLAVAGPIEDDGRIAHLTNLPWRVDADALEREFGLPPVRLVNDFAAAALGAVTAADDQRTPLQEGEPLATAPRLVVGAGTGLGMAVLLPEASDPGGWRVIPGEGGHSAFAPADARQAELWAFLRRRHGRVTWERVLSGPGLVAIHQFLTGDVCPADQVGEEALDIFLSAYGAFAGDMALAVLARGGVFLAGGIAATRLADLRQGAFLRAFTAKAEHAAIAARMPVHVATDPALGLRGASLLANLGNH